MKQLYLIIVVLLVSGVSRAQSICDSCCAESFPYDFCSALGGHQFTQCSSNPNADGNPVKSFIPTCVNVGTMPTNALWQPNGPPPTPASLLSNSDLDNNTDEEAGASTQFDNDQTLYNQFPAEAPVPPTAVDDPGAQPEDTCTQPSDMCGDEPTEDCGDKPTDDDCVEPYCTSDCDDTDCLNTYYDGDPSECAGAWTSYNTCESTFETHLGIWQACEDTFTAQRGRWESCHSQFETDSANWVTCQNTFASDSAAWPGKEAAFKRYEGAYLQYQADSTSWVANLNSYTLVFDTTQAQADAQMALNGWLGVCTPPVQPCPSRPPCCLQVVMDDDVRDFPDNPTGTLAKTLTPGSSTVVPCKDSLCPSAIIEVNVTDEFLATNRLDAADSGVTPSQYTLYQVSRTEFYTGLTPPDSVAPGYSAYSFFQLMEHEIGHYLGLNHPDDTVTGGHECNNCYTANPFVSPTGVVNASGVRTVMAENNNIPNPGYNDPLLLTGEDSCQFQKLYCNSCGGGSGIAPCAYVDGVTPPVQDEFTAEIYPNPTTGSTELDYTVPQPSLVHVAIYDILGNQVRMVSFGYENAGSQSISLGTESLPSGSYVCRVRVGDRVSYINLSITK